MRIMTTALGGLILVCVLAHVVLSTRDMYHFARLEEQVAAINVGDTLDQVRAVMGEPDARWEHTKDVSTLQDLGPGFAYRKNMNWKDPFFPFRIRQTSHDTSDIVIYFDTGSLVREIQTPQDTE